MNVQTQQILAVARNEWRVAWRGLGLKLVLLLVALPFAALNLAPGHNIAPWADDGGLGNLTSIAPFAALLAAFLIVPTSRRERVLHGVDLLWARPLSGQAYLIGKMLGAVLIMAVLVAEMAILVVLYQLTGGGIIGVPLLVGLIVAVAPALLLTAVLCVACGTLLPHPLFGYLVAFGFCAIFGFFLTESMVLLWNPWTQTLSYDRFLGFALDLPLLLVNRLFYAGLLVLVVGGTLLIFTRRERRALVPRSQGRLALAALVLGALVAAAAAPLFGAAAAAVTPSGPVVAPSPVTLAITDYRLDLRLDPANGEVDGVARFRVYNDGKTPVVTLPLYLNDGLRVRAAWVDGHDVAVRDAALFGTLALAHPLLRGVQASVRVSYAGRYKILRAQYAGVRTGLLGTPATMLSPPLHQSLIGAGVAFLFRDGDWYPLPWTGASTAWSPAPLGWRTVRVRLPASVATATSGGDVQRRGGDQIVTWALSGHLPTALLAAVGDGYTRLAVPGGVVYTPTWDAHDVGSRYGPYVGALHDLTAFFGRPARPIVVVAVPPSREGGAIGVRAAVGDGLAMVPVDSLDQTPGGAVGVVSRLAPPAPYRAALNDMAVAWWRDNVPARRGPDISGPSVDLPTGYISVADTSTLSGFDRSQMLAGYTGAAVAGLHLGPRFYAREMEVRRAADALTLHDQGNRALTLLQRGEGPLSVEMRSLGLSGRVGVDASPALDDIRRRIGAERLRRALVALADTGQPMSDIDDATCALSRATGQPVAALAYRYLGQFALSVGKCR